jgi:EmrB/QacA subfamily drug resistance transporter
MLLHDSPGEVRQRPRPNNHAAALRPKQLWMGLATILLAAFMQLLDITVVNVAIPTIQRDLQLTSTRTEWLIAGYQLAFAAGLVTGGRLGDLYGRKRVFVLGLLGFVVASVACGVATGPNSMVAARLVQGLAGAVMFPQVLSTIQAAFPQHMRKQAFAFYGATIGLASVAGPLIGGALIEANALDLEWRPIFLVNVPIGLLAAGGAAILLPESRAGGPRRLDVIGAAMASLAMLLFVLPLIEGREAGWPPWVWISFVASALMTVLFIGHERRMSASGRVPLVNLGMFRQSTYSRGLVLSMLSFVGVAGFFFVLAVYLQGGFSFSAIEAGLTLLPFAVASMASSGLAVALVPRFGRKVLMVGAATLTAGFILFVVTVLNHAQDIGALDLAPSFLLAGAGLGAIIAPMQDIVLVGIESTDAGAASGVLTTVQQIGGAIGVALIGILFFNSLDSATAESLDGVIPDVRSRLSAAGLSGPMLDQATAQFRACYVDRSLVPPTAIPPSCQELADQLPAASQASGVELTGLAQRARREGFSISMARAGLFEVGVFILTLILLMLLPGRARRGGRHRGQPRASRMFRRLRLARPSN